MTKQEEKFCRITFLDAGFHDGYYHDEYVDAGYSLMRSFPADWTEKDFQNYFSTRSRIKIEWFDPEPWEELFT